MIHLVSGRKKKKEKKNCWIKSAYSRLNCAAAILCGTGAEVLGLSKLTPFI